MVFKPEQSGTTEQAVEALEFGEERWIDVGKDGEIILNYSEPDGTKNEIPLSLEQMEKLKRILELFLDAATEAEKMIKKLTD